ncbi:MAG: leucine-rich repeat domain-containing protein [Phycisphaerae bacterium]|nr:leucine-rich repeat domain-containing protein [Phycisphaerae bacterium]
MRIQGFISIFIFMIVLLFLPATASAEDYIWTDNGNGTCTINDYVGPGGDVTIPDTLGGLTVITIQYYAFRDCSSLTSVVIPKSVTTIAGDWVFSGCSRLTAINVDPLNPAYSSLSGVLYNKDKSVLIFYPEGKIGNYTIPNSVITLEGNAFKNSSGLTSIIIGDSVTDIGYQAFLDCANLVSAIIGDSVTIIGPWAFRGCSNLTSVTIGDSVTIIEDGAFLGCSSLTSISIPSNVITIDSPRYSFAFQGCSNLTAINVDTLNPVYSSLSGILFNKDQSVLIYYPEGKKIGDYTIPNSVTSIGERAFFHNSCLVSVTIGDSVTDIGGGSGYMAFGDCSNLTSVTIGDGLTEIDYCTFWGCRNLSNVIIGDNVTSIDYQAFLGCPNLNTVIFGESLTGIGDDAFRDSRFLSGLYFKGDPPVINPLSYRYLLNPTVFYLPENTGWGASIGGLPTAPWPILNSDFNLDRKVIVSDFANLASHWMETGCQASNNWCDGTDIDTSGDVGLSDLVFLVDNWMTGTSSLFILDNFDNNQSLEKPVWTRISTGDPNIVETNQRLEIVATTNSNNDVCLYAPYAWNLNTSDDFGFKIRYHNEIVSESWSELLLALGDPLDIENNHLQFSVCSLNGGDYSGSYFYFERVQNGSLISEEYIQRISNDGWIYISFDAELDEVYFGIDGYGHANAVRTVSGLFNGDWSDKKIGPHIGGSSYHVEILSGQAYWDDLIMDYGNIISQLRLGDPY